jgi:hypothetical protein
MQNFDNTVKNILITFLFIIVIYILYVLQSILIPLFLALLVAIMFQPLIAFLLKIKTPSWLILPTISIITLGILFGLFFLVNEILDDLLVNQEFILKRLNLKMDSMLRWINKNTGLRFNANDDFGGIFRFYRWPQPNQILCSCAKPYLLAHGVLPTTGSCSIMAASGGLAVISSFLDVFPVRVMRVAA